MRNCKKYLALCLAIAWAASVQAEEHRQHGAHEHGAGQLNVVVENNKLMIELSLPAMNVVGFEHPATTTKERELLSQAATWLRDGNAMFAPSEAAHCKLVNAELESALLDDAMHEPAEEHADFDVSYEFDCAQPERLAALSARLFQRFPGTQHLRTQVISATAQSGGEIDADNPVIELK